MYYAGPPRRRRAALAWLEPADVRIARAAGRRVRRHGDVYAVGTTAAHDTPTGMAADTHHWDAASRYLTHRPVDGRRHRPVRLPWPVRFVAQSALTMGGGGYGTGD